MGSRILPPIPSPAKGFVTYRSERNAIAIFRVRMGAVETAQRLLWWLHNFKSTAADVPNSIVYITRVQVVASFDGTAEATTSRYRFFGAFEVDLSTLPATTTVPGNKFLQLDAAGNVVTDAARQNAVAITTSVATFSYTSGFGYFELGCPRTPGAAAVFDWKADPADVKANAIQLAPGDAFVLDLGAASVVGDGLIGYVEYSARFI